MEEKHLKLQPSNYIPSTEAASRFGLTNDHIASLCRRHKVAGELKAGRVWFVNEDSLQEYLARAAAEKEMRNKALSEKIRREHRTRETGEELVLNLRHAAALALPLFLALLVNAPSIPQGALQAAAPAVAQYEEILNIAVELQVDAYETLGAAINHPAVQEIPVASARFYEGLARDYIGLVEQAGDLQEQAYAAAIGTMYVLADEMSAATVMAIEDVSYSANAAAVYFVESSQKVHARTQLR